MTRFFESSFGDKMTPNTPNLSEAEATLSGQAVIADAIRSAVALPQPLLLLNATAIVCWGKRIATEFCWAQVSLRKRLRCLFRSVQRLQI